MISLHCTQCRQLLEMDDAFAGGVCRCQHCGTIQTVPRAGRGGASASSKGSSNKALYKKGVAGQHPGGADGDRAAAAAPGTGLDELAEIVASSGLARGSLSKPPPRQRPAADAAAPADDEAGGPARPGGGRKSSTPRLVAGGAAAAAVLGVVLFLALKSSGPPAGPTAAGPGTAGVRPAATAPAARAEPAGPSFAGVALPTGSVVYLIDRSQANDDVLDALKSAAYRSAASLGPDRRFQIVFWHRVDEGIVAYPEDALAAATTPEVEAAAKRFEDVVAYGSTDLKPTLEKALASKPDSIVLATAKGFQFEESNVATVRDALNGAPVKIHTFSLGEAESATLKQIAIQTGGEYREVAYNKLRAGGP